MAAAIQRGVCLTTSVFAQLPLQSTASIKTTSSSSCVFSRVGLGSSFVPQNFPHEEALCIPVKTRGPGRQSRRPVQALFGGGGKTEEKKKKGIKREEEPDEYFQTKAEKQGKSTLADPLAIVGILSIFLPFIILGAAFAAGLVKLPS